MSANDIIVEGVEYEVGETGEGESEFVQQTFAAFNQMDSTEARGKVLASLIGSENAFNMTNTFAQDEKGNDIKVALAFAGSESGGGQIHAGEL